ncbi:unnamed protein product [Phytophthora fragariaefolia]|uniref:Unnamed protein product n=1 Tax=Phytophthora fragariaefolia TaxID=1490495 RepID=A0A9W7CXC9_9STRA|nr:unnamed protein product [Phytophthora fragariaefolia]
MPLHKQPAENVAVSPQTDYCSPQMSIYEQPAVACQDDDLGIDPQQILIGLTHQDPEPPSCISRALLRDYSQTTVFAHDLEILTQKWGIFAQNLRRFCAKLGDICAKLGDLCANPGNNLGF